MNTITDKNYEAHKDKVISYQHPTEIRVMESTHSTIITLQIIKAIIDKTTK